VGVTLEEGRTVLERLQERVREFDFPDRSGEPCLEVTVSVGLMSATVPNTYLEPEDLDAYMGHCDRALYLAKSLGNNKLVSDSFCGETAAE
jgi:PleD family two-component response regulator